MKQCKYCGTNHNLRQCPAYGKKCSKCNMKNHFAKMCRSRDQESQRRTQKPVKSVSKKPTRSIHRIEEAEPAITDDEFYCMYSVINSSRSKNSYHFESKQWRTCVSQRWSLPWLPDWRKNSHSKIRSDWWCSKFTGIRENTWGVGTPIY